MKYTNLIKLKGSEGSYITIVVDGNRLKILGTWEHLKEFEVISAESKRNLDALSQDDDSICIKTFSDLPKLFNYF